MEDQREGHQTVAAHERPTGTWHMIDAQDRTYGIIEIRRVMNDTKVRYRASFRGEVIGWSSTLRLACERIHREFLRAHGPSGGPIASWGAHDRSQAVE